MNAPLNSLLRQPPHDLEMEMAVAGSVLIDPNVLDEIESIVQPSDFYDDANRIIFEQVLAMRKDGERIDIPLVISRLKDADKFEIVGGGVYLARLSNAATSIYNAPDYAKRVADKSRRRRLIKACQESIKDAFDNSDDSIDLVSQAEQRIFAIAESGQNESLAMLDDALHEFFDSLDAKIRGDAGSDTGLETGFFDLDSKTGGLKPGELYIVAGRPSMGKTAFALNVTANAAIDRKTPTLFVSLEMCRQEITNRLVSTAARIDASKLQCGGLNQTERDRVVETGNLIIGSPLMIDDTPSRTITNIAAVARRFKRKQNGLGLVVVDYLQLIAPDNPRDPRQEQVAKLARRIKCMARELSVPVICLSQLNRQSEDSKDHRPRLSHLRESGAIEQDADAVLFLHRAAYFLRDDERKAAEGKAEIIIAKQRNGPIGEVPVTWESRYASFRNSAPAYYDMGDYS